MYTIRLVGAAVAFVASFFLLLFLFIKLAGPIPFSVSSVTTTKTDTFTVTGEGTSVAKPDLATVNIGINATGASVKEIQDQINNVINKVSESIKKTGVEDKDIQTTNYSIQPQYDFRGNTQRITGYQASTNLTVKVRNLNNINTVIDAATTNGANEIGGVAFDVADKTKAENQARETAVAAAKKKAEEAAKIAGFNLGKIINYSENLNGYPTPRVFSSKDLNTTSIQEAPTEIQPGSSEIKVTVVLSYEIR